MRPTLRYKYPSGSRIQLETVRVKSGKLVPRTLIFFYFFFWGGTAFRRYDRAEGSQSVRAEATGRSSTLVPTSDRRMTSSGRSTLSSGVPCHPSRHPTNEEHSTRGTATRHARRPRTKQSRHTRIIRKHADQLVSSLKIATKALRRHVAAAHTGPSTLYPPCSDVHQTWG